MNLSNLAPLAKISGLTIAGAFLGALSSASTMPTTFAEWKAVLLPALWAAFLAERVLLQSTVGAQLAASPLPYPGTITPAAPAALPPAGAK